MTVPAMDEALKKIHESIQRKKGSFELAKAPEGFALAAGSWRAIRVDGGFIICLQLSREKVEYLKGQCEEALAKNA
jgi:hypothetical protein